MIMLLHDNNTLHMLRSTLFVLMWQESAFMSTQRMTLQRSVVNSFVEEQEVERSDSKQPQGRTFEAAPVAKSGRWLVHLAQHHFSQWREMVHQALSHTHVVGSRDSDTPISPNSRREGSVPQTHDPHVP